MNKRGSEVTGYTYQELMQMRVWDLLHPEDLKRVFAAGKERIEGADIPSRFMARILTKSGKAIPMDTGCRADHIPGGAGHHGDCAGRDGTGAIYQRDGQ